MLLFCPRQHPHLSSVRWLPGRGREGRGLRGGDDPCGGRGRGMGIQAVGVTNRAGASGSGAHRLDPGREGKRRWLEVGSCLITKQGDVLSGAVG